MEPFILCRAALAAHVPWRDTQTDIDPLPATVATDANGLTVAAATRVTEVRQETTDDQ
jgi:hypothetical protein